jgi:hypothetical protein
MVPGEPPSLNAKIFEAAKKIFGDGRVFLLA